MIEKPEQQAGAEQQTSGASGRYCFRLYIAGQTVKSVLAIRNLKRICETHLNGRYEIECVNLIDSPSLAMGDQILATPTLIRRLPAPPRRIIGDLSNTEKVLGRLDIHPTERMP